MPDNEIDTLRIIVEGDSDHAVKSLDELLARLDKIKSVTGKGTASLKRITDPIDKISASISKFSGEENNIDRVADALSKIGSTKISVTISKRLSEIKDAINGTDTDKLASIVDGMSKLGGMRLSAPRSAGNTTSAVVPTSSVLRLPNVPINVRAPSPMQLPSYANVEKSASAVRETTRRATEATAAIQDATKKTHVFASALQTAGRIGASALGKVGNIVGKIGSGFWAGIKTVGRGIGNLVTGPFKLLNAAVTRVHKRAGNLLTIVKKRVLYRAINAVISAITNAFKEGVNNIYQYSKALEGPLAASMDRASTSFLYMKNALGSLVAPLINMIVPALENVARKVVDITNLIAETFARISGATSWTRALWYPTEYAEAANEATKANEKLKKSILGIDELNILADNSPAANNEKDYSKMFEEVDLKDSISFDALDDKATSFFDRLKASLANLRDLFGKLLDPFVLAWQNKGEGLINAIKNAFRGLVNLADALGESFLAVWTNGTGQRTLELLLSIFTNFLNLVGNLSDSFARAWREGGVGTQIIQSWWNIFNYILGLVNDITASLAEWAKTVDFGPLLRAVAAVSAKLEKFVAILTKDISEAFDKYFVPLLTWITETALPLIVRMLGPIIDMFSKMWELVKAIGRSIVSIEFTSEAKKSFYLVLALIYEIVSLVGTLAEKLKEAWEKNNVGTRILTTILGIFNDILALVVNVLRETEKWIEKLDLDPLFESLANALESLREAFSNLWDFVEKAYRDIILPIAKWVVESLIPLIIDSLIPTIDGISAVIRTLGDAILTLWNTILKPVLEWLNENFSDFFDFMKDQVEEVRSVTEDKTNKIAKIWQTLSDALTKTWEALEPLFSKIGETIVWIYNLFKLKIELIVDGIAGFKKALIDGLNGIITFVEDVFSGQWSGAWNDIYKTFSDIVEDIKETVETIKTDILNTWGPVIDAYKNVFNAVVAAMRSFLEDRINEFIDFANGLLEIVNKVLSVLPGFGDSTISLLEHVNFAIEDGGVTVTLTDLTDLGKGKFVDQYAYDPTDGERGPDAVEVGLAVEQMREAAAENARQMEEQNELLRGLLNKENVTFVGSEDILAGLDRMNRRNGITAIPVYAP